MSAPLPWIWAPRPPSNTCSSSQAFFLWLLRLLWLRWLRRGEWVRARRALPRLEERLRLFFFPFFFSFFSFFSLLGDLLFSPSRGAAPQTLTRIPAPAVRTTAAAALDGSALAPFVDL